MPERRDWATIAHVVSIELVAALKHDLAKYVAWRSANLDESAWSEPDNVELCDALRADLLATRTRDGAAESAWQVWDRLAAGLEQPLPRELECVRSAVDILRAAEPELRAGRLPGSLAPIRAAQDEIRWQLRELHRRLLAEQG